MYNRHRVQGSSFPGPFSRTRGHRARGPGHISVTWGVDHEHCKSRDAGRRRRNRDGAVRHRGERAMPQRHDHEQRQLHGEPVPVQPHERAARVHDGSARGIGNSPAAGGICASRRSKRGKQSVCVRGNGLHGMLFAAHTVAGDMLRTGVLRPRGLHGHDRSVHQCAVLSVRAIRTALPTSRLHSRERLLSERAFPFLVYSPRPFPSHALPHHNGRRPLRFPAPVHSIIVENIP